MSNVNELFLARNQITDVTPLGNLTQLMALFLEGNQIVDITPLSNLQNLSRLTLMDNPIDTPTCPVEPERACRF
jgi:internalin A